MPSFFGIIARNKFLVFLLISTASILAGMYFLNDIVLSVRMMELEGFLKRINRETSQVDELGMVSKYKLHLQLYNQEIDDRKFDEEELSTVYLATSYEVQSKTSMTKYSEISGPVIWIINILRMPLGKAPIEALIDNPSDTELTLAYYFERNKNFKRALYIYEKAVSGKLIADDKIPIVLLHEGYCRSLMGEYDAAKSIFISIIKDYDNENTAITAALMLQYLETIQSEVDKVKSSGDSGIVKSEKLYRLIAYEDAIEVLEKLQPQNEKEAMQIAFLNARCLEETGKTEESVRMYQGIIESDSGSDAAKAANRRLLVMASVDDGGDKMKELAKRNNEIIKDGDFNLLLVTSDKVDESKEQLDPADKKKIEEEIAEDRKISRSATDDTTAVAGAGTDTENMDTFIDNAIKTIDSKTRKVPVIVTEEPARTQSPAPTNMQAQKPTPDPTPVPTQRPIPERTPAVTQNPTAEPTPKPSQRPTIEPTPEPTLTPSPAPEITQIPTVVPSPEPTLEPTLTPSPAPEITQIPTVVPSPEPTPEPALTPSPAPEITQIPTVVPSPEPTLTPSPTPGKPYQKDYKDSRGIIYKTEMFDGNGKLDTIQYKDETGVVYKTEKYGENEKIESVSLMDAKGNINKIMIYDESGNLDKTIMYEFDDNGNPVRIKVYDKNGNLLDDP